MTQSAKLEELDRQPPSSSGNQDLASPAPRAPVAYDLTLEAVVPLGKRRAPGSTPTLDRPTPPSSSGRLAKMAAMLPEVAREAYAFGREVAKGGIGRVVGARDRRLDRPVAIKELLVWNEWQEQRFVREALLTARLQHPAVVPIYEAGRWPNGEPFYAMKLVSGRTLADLIDERGSLGERLGLLPHVLTVAQAIAYAHSKRIIHRDLKPANVLVGEFGETVVIDWGVAKDLAEESEGAREGPSAPAAEGLTLQGSIVGTPAYMPPEQAAGAPVDERADVYAIGAMLYHLLAAVPPYHGEKWEGLLALIARKAPRPIERLAPQISDELAAIVHKAMARDPAARYSTAKDLADDLERFQAGRIVAAHTYSVRELLQRSWRRNRPVLSAAAIAFALVTLVLIAAFVKTDRDRRYAELKEKEAVSASRSAEAATRAAEAAVKQATMRADEMTLLHAEGALGRDPNEVLAWLETLSPELVDAGKVRWIAADAQARGLSRAFRGHAAHINSLTLSADGRRFVSASDDKTARIWDIETARSVVLSGHGDEVWNVVFLPGGDELASLSKDATMRLWDARTGAERAKIDVPGATRQLIAREDGALLGTPMSGGTAWIRRPGAAAVEILTDPSERQSWAYFSKNGRRLLIQKEDGSCYVRDVDGPARTSIPGSKGTHGEWFLDDRGTLALRADKDAAELWQLASSKRFVIDKASIEHWPTFSSDGALMAFGTGEGIFVHDTRTGALVRKLVGHEGVIYVLSFSPDGRRLVSGGFDRTVRSWSIATGESEVHAGLGATVTDVKFLPDGRTIVASSSSGSLRLFEPRRSGKVLTDHGAPTPGLAISSAGRVASLDDRGRLRVSDLEGRLIAEHALPPASRPRLWASRDGSRFAGAAPAWVLSPEGAYPDRKAPPGAIWFGTFDEIAPKTIPVPAAILDFAWAADGEAVIAGLVDGTVRRVERGGAITEIDRLAGPVPRVMVSADGAWIAAGDDEGNVRLTELSTGRHRALGRHKARVTALAFSPDGALLASGCEDHTARLWRLADGSFRSFDEGGHGVGRVAFSGDGKTLFLLSLGETQLRRLKVETGEQLPSFAGNRSVLLGFLFSRDNRWILMFGTDGAVRLVDSESGEGRGLVGHKDAVMGAVFAAGRGVMVTAGYDGTVRAWPDDLPETMPELRAWIGAATRDPHEGG